jgi:excisionase family DNA binding protein
MAIDLEYPSSPMPRLLEVAHVAHTLRLSPEQVRRLIRTRQLPAIRLGHRWRVEPAVLQRFIDAQRVPTDYRGQDGAEA